MTGGALAALLDLPEVASAMTAARAEVDTALRHRALRHPGRLAPEIGLRAAVASAALEGHRYDLEEVRAGAVADPVVQGALRCGAALPGLASTWAVAPRQALARLHVLAARGCPEVSDAVLGRPSGSAATLARLETLCVVMAALGDGTPGLLGAAVVHGELLAVHAFAGPNGVVARAAARLALLASGLDPSALIAPELGHLAREPEYVGAATAFATGTVDGVRAWLRHCARSAEVAAAELVAVAQS